MAFTFLQSEGFEIGSSIVDKDSLDFCKEILEKYPDKIILPVDVLVNTVYEDVKNPELRLISEIKDDEMGLDIGPNTEKLFEKSMLSADLP